MLQVIKNHKYLLLTIAFMVFYTFWNSHYPLGNWESLTLFHFLGAESISYFFDISKRANIGGLGLFPLEFARSFMEAFGWSLITARLPSLMIGMAVVVTLFFYLKRFLPQSVTFFAVLIFFTNPIFQVFLHQSNVVIISFGLGFFYFFLLEKIYGERKLFYFILLACLAIPLSSYYSFGRFLGAMGSFLLGCHGVYLILKKRTSWKAELKNWTTFFMIYFAGHAFLGVNNLKVALSFSEFFFPFNASEVVSVNQDLFTSLIKNFEIYAKTFFSLRGYYSSFSYDILGSALYPMLPLWLLPIFFLGFFILVKTTIKNKNLESYHATFFIWTIVGFVLPLFSVYYTNGTFTISVYRTFFSLLPSIFLYAFGLGFIAEKKSILLPIISLLIIIGQLLVIESDRKKFQQMVVMAQSPQYLSDIQLQKGSGANIEHFRNFVLPEKIPILKNHLLFQSYYIGKAKEILSKIETSNNMVTLVDINFDQFEKVFPNPPMIHVLEKSYYHSLFLALYLSDLGADVSYIQVKFANPMVLHEVEFDSEARQFPIKYSLLNEVLYANRSNIHYAIRKTGNGQPKIFLATHPVERDLAIKELNAQRALYRVVEIK